MKNDIILSKLTVRKGTGANGNGNVLDLKWLF